LPSAPATSIAGALAVADRAVLVADICEMEMDAGKIKAALAEERK